MILGNHISSSIQRVLTKNHDLWTSGLRSFSSSSNGQSRSLSVISCGTTCQDILFHCHLLAVIASLVITSLVIPSVVIPLTRY